MRGYLTGVLFCCLFTGYSWAQVPVVRQTVQPDDEQRTEQWLATGGYHAARQEFEKIYSALPPANQKHDVLFYLLRCTFEDQEYEDAYYWSSDFLKEFPNDRNRTTALVVQGISAFQTKRLEIALRALDEFLSIAGDHPMRGAAYFWRAMAKLDRGDWQTAEADIQQCYENRETAAYHDVALMGWALSLERRGEYQKAIDLLEQFIQKFPESSLLSDVKIRLASLYLRIGSPLQATQILDKLEPGSHQQEEYLLLRAEANLQTGRYQEAESESQKFLTDFPRSRFFRRAQYALGWSLLRKHEYPQAQASFDSLGTGNDSLAFASLYQSASLALLQDKPMEAIARYDTLTEHSPYDIYAEKAYFQIGMTQYRLKRYREARRSFQLAARMFPESLTRTNSYYMLGESNIALGDFSNAQYAFSQVRRLGSTSEFLPRSMFQEGICLYHLGRFKSSADMFDEFFQRFPRHSLAAEAYVWRGEALYQDGRYADAERSYADALRLFPNNPKRVEASYGLAWTLFEQKKFSQAAKAFDRFVEQNPQNDRVLDATLRQADCYAFMGEYDKSNALYLEIGELKKDSRYKEYAAFQIAMSYIQRGETERGIEQLRNFLIRFPASIYDEVAQFNIGWTYFSKNQFNQSLDEFRTVLRKYPLSQLMPRVLFNMGDAFYNLKQYDSARVYYQRVPREFPTSALVSDALAGLQYTYEAEGKPAEALAQIDTLMHASTSGIPQEELVMKKGDILFGQGDFGGAVLEYQKVLAMKPSPEMQAKTLYQLGRSFEMENNSQNSIVYFRRVVTQFPEMEFTPSAALALGNGLIKTKQYRDALDGLKDFETRYPSSPLVPEVCYQRGVALAGQKETRQAIDQFSVVIGKYPNDVFADRSRMQIAGIHTSMKAYKAAIDTLGGIVTRRNDDLAAEALIMIGGNYYAMKKYVDALQSYKDLYTQYTDFPLYVEKAHFGAAQCYERLGNRKQARSEYEQVVNSGVDQALRKQAQEKVRRLRK
jgi:TolA-binding protein